MTIEQIIKEKGPILSTDILNILISTYAIKPDAARKRLSRLKNPNIKRIKGLFTDGQILFYDQSIFASEEYYEGIRDAFEKSGKQYYNILIALDYHYGSIKYSQLASYSSNPVKNLIGHKSFSIIFNNLINLNLVTIDGEYIHINPSISLITNDDKRSKGIEIAKNFILVQFNDWARKIGFVSYNTSTFHSDFGKFQFSFVSPSYIGTMPKYITGKIIPGFVFADILIGNQITPETISFYTQKINTLKSQKNLPAFIPFLIVDSLDIDSLNSLKKNGVVIGFVNQLFGEEYNNLLESLINLVKNAGAILKKNPDAYLDLILKLNKLVDGKTNNLRGDLFELAVGYYHGRSANIIEIGKNIIFEGKRREMDIWSIYPDKIVVSECKGYNSRISKEEIEKWFSDKVSVIRGWIINQPSLSEKIIQFEFWSTGGFDDDALEILSDRKQKTKKYKIEYFDLEAMVEKSKNAGTKKLTEILSDYFIKHV